MPKHKPKAVRINQILDAAIVCFSKHGYYEATMDAIAHEAGLSKGSLYLHFDGKRAVFRSLFDRYYEDLNQRMGEAVSTQMTARGKMESILSTIEHSALAQPELMRAQLEFLAMAVRDQEYREWMQSMYAQAVKLFQSIIDEGIARGEFRKVDSHVIALMTAAMIDGYAIQRELMPAPSDAKIQNTVTLGTLFALLEPS